MKNDRLYWLLVSNMTPLKTPTEFTEKKLTPFLAVGQQQADHYIELAEPIEKIKIPLILISHTPPSQTTTDRLNNGPHVGSTAVCTFIEKYQPDLCIVDHIHKAAGSDRIGRTAN